MKNFGLGIGVAIVLFLALVFGFLNVCCRGERPESHYNTYQDAVNDGAVRRGWIPAGFPKSAFDIYEKHDLDTNVVWIRCSFRDMEDLKNKKIVKCEQKEIISEFEKFYKVDEGKTQFYSIGKDEFIAIDSIRKELYYIGMKH